VSSIGGTGVTAHYWGRPAAFIFGRHVIHFSRKIWRRTPSIFIETLISTAIFTHFCLKTLASKRVQV
jgi:hypothetical protein